MPTVKKAIKVSLLVLVMAAIACGCSNSISIADKTPATIKIYPAMAELPAGETLLLKVNTASSSTEDMSVEWKSSDDRIASVSENGCVTAIAEGEAVMEAFLVNDKRQKSTCRIVVKEDGPILLFSIDEKEDENNASNGASGSHTQNPPGIGAPQGEPEQLEPPDIPDDSQGETEQGGMEEEIPVEHDPELDIPVEHDPRLDEYIWAIRINDTLEQDIGDSGLPLKLVYKLQLNVVKKGGKTSEGIYEGNATLEMKVDTGKLSKEILEKSEGLLSKFMVNVGGNFSADSLSMKVGPYKHKDFSNFDKGSGDGSGDTITIAPLVPKDGGSSGGPEIVELKPREDAGSGPEIVPLVPKFGMALGYALFEGSGAFGISTMDISGVGIDSDEQMGSSVALTYKLSIGSAGKIDLKIAGLGINSSFSGRISKKPMVPR